MKIKILALLCVFAMTLPILAACDDKEPPVDSDNKTETTTDTTTDTEPGNNTNQTEKTYIVEFVTSGGSRVPAGNYSVITEEPVTTREGYVFEGWYLTEDFSDEGVTYPFTVTENTVFYAKWYDPTQQGGNEDPDTFHLSFIVNGGLPVASMTDVSVVQKEPATERAGYVFRGWFTDKDYTGNRVTFPYTLTADTVFYAKWEPVAEVTYLITLEANGGTCDTGTLSGKEGTKINAFPTPTKKNADFEGWYTTPDFAENSKVTFPYEIIDDVTVYAKWKVNETTTPEDTAVIREFLKKNYHDYTAAYLMEIRNTNGIVYKAESYYTLYGTSIFESAPYQDENGDWHMNSDGTYRYYKTYGFYRDEEGSYILYSEDSGGNYLYNGLYYSTLLLKNPEDYFYMTYLSKLAQLDPSQFYLYDGKWYAKSDYADIAGRLILGNPSGDPSQACVYSSFALIFDENGVLKNIEASSSVAWQHASDGVTTNVTYYYYQHNIEIGHVGEVPEFNEDMFLADQERPSGYYPVLNEKDENRQNIAGDGVAYTTDQLQAAIDAMTKFTAYYTFAGNTFNGFLYSPITLYHNQDRGKVVIGAYPSYTSGNYTSVAQEAAPDQFYYYSASSDAFFRLIRSGSGYAVYCDQYSYKNNMDYNQYLNGLDGAILYNCKLPTASLSGMKASDFTYNAELGCFEFRGSAEEMTAFGKLIFGDEDIAYPEANETEAYTAFRLYMKDGKLVRVYATSTMSIDGVGTEFFVKELVITDYKETPISLPVETSLLIAPGEAKENGSVEALKNALVNTGSNYKYTDNAVYDYFEEIVRLSDDVYIYTDNMSKILGANGNDYFVFWRDGVPYVAQKNNTQTYKLDSTFGGDVYETNAWIRWATPINYMLDADWFYEGKDGKFYGKPEYMTEISAVLARYTGTKTYLEYPQVGSYTWNVVLDFVAVELNNGKLDNFYYSGVVRIKGFGTTDMPFSGYGKFNLESQSLTLPVSGQNPDSKRPQNMKLYLPCDMDFSVDKDGILHISGGENASSFVANIYNMSNNLLKTVTVTDGMNMKSDELGLLVSNAENLYKLSLTAKGDENWYDSEASEARYFVVSRIPQAPTPDIRIDKAGQKLTVTGSWANGWHVSILNSKKVEVLSRDITGELDLSSLAPGLTYTIMVYAKGDNVNTINSEEVTGLYTPYKGEQTYIDELFGKLDGSQNISMTLNSQTSAKYSVYNASGNRIAGLKLEYKFDAATKKGNITVIRYDAEGSPYYPEYIQRKAEFIFDLIDGKLVGTLTVTGRNNEEISSESLTLDTFPLIGLGALDEAEFTETSGSLNAWTGVTYSLSETALQDASVQEMIAAASFLDEMLGIHLTYTAVEITTAYGTGEALNSNGNSITLIAVDDNGNVYECKFAPYFG